MKSSAATESANHPSNKASTAGKSRREFLCGGALLGFLGFSSTAAAMARREDAAKNAILISNRPDAPYDLCDPENTLYTACLQCNTGCGIKAKLQNGVVTKIDGNPYNPWTLLPHLDYGTDVEDAARIDGAICPKGQAGLQTAYDPYRIRRVLKRTGPRGSNQWASIPFDQAMREICDGGTLFSHVAGEESRNVEGLRSIMALTDPKVGKAMAADVKAYLSEKDPAKKQALIEKFKTDHAAHLDKLIDPDHPDLGPKNNQLVFAWGRLKAGRGDFYKRLAAAYGTVNAHGHTTVCQGSLYFTCKAISDQYIAGKFSEGKKFYWQADAENSKFILFVGANIFEANYGPPNRTVRLTSNLVSGKTKIAVADPRYSKAASKAWKWLPLQPGSDAPLALAMIRWILDNDRQDSTFLRAANKAAANAVGEPSWSNATWLVEIGPDGTPGKFIRAADFGLAEAQERSVPDPKDKTKSITYTEPFMVVMVDGKPTALDPNDANQAVHGDLYADTELTRTDGKKVRVKSGLQILAESARQHTITEWAEMCGVRERDIIDTARELTSHGKAVAVDVHRGPAQHTNGFYNVLAWMSLNMLLGNFDHVGGMIKGTTYDIAGKKGGPFNIEEFPDKPTAFGISSIRHGVNYEQTSLFEGYPAKRNWYPLSSDVYEEIIPSIGDAYPYPVKALIFYMGAPTYALPAGHTNIDILRDTNKLPLFISNDILIGTTSMYADYIFPDLSFLERWEFQGTHPNISAKVQPIRQPVMAPIPEECTVFGQTMPISFESLLLGIAEQLKLPGFGEDAFAPGQPFQHQDDLYLRCVANLAHGEAADGSKAVPDASPEEIRIFLEARSHLPKSVFDPTRWKSIVGEKLWPKVITVLNRGGRFQNHDDAYQGELVKNQYAGLLNMYQEKTAGTIHSGTGKKYPGIACHVAIRDYHGNEPTALREGHPLQLITHRTITQTKSRTITNPWLSPIMPENAVLLHPQDAAPLGLETGDEVRVVSATNKEGTWPLGPVGDKPMIGRVVLTQTIRPGVTSFALGFGNWATGAADLTIDNHVIKGDRRRQKGIHANAAMWVDPALGNTCFLDPVGGSVSFYDTSVRLEKVPRGTLPATADILKAT